MKKYVFSVIYGALLVAFTAYVLLYIYVLPQKGKEVVNPSTEVGVSIEVDEDRIVITEDTYIDGNVEITLTTHRVDNTNVYVADVVIAEPSLLKTALAEDRYGRNIKEKTSKIAEDKNAILAINGDYYSAREGCVLRNGTLYRGFDANSGDESLVIYANGTAEIVTAAEGDSEALKAADAMQILSFGPALVEGGDISVTPDDEVDKAMANNPRTAFVYYSSGHYAFVVGDGRTSESKGLSLYRLAELLQDLGAVHAYNLDGGGSSTMYFNGRVVNNPTTNGKKISEREVSDIVYIGYNY